MKHFSASLAFLAGSLIAVLPASAASYSFQTINNPGDPNFNQLLGVNNSGTIVGYFGDGTVAPNKGYSLVPPGSFTNENFPGSTQTQVIGINNNASPVTVGFWVDGIGNNFGFVDQGNSFTSVKDPNTPGSAPSLNQLLGINDHNVAAGFYTNAAGVNQGYLYNISTGTFSPVLGPNGASTVATGINNGGLVSGFYTDAAGNTHGFLDMGNTFHSYDDPNGGATNTMFLGLNNNGEAVGSYTGANGETDGFVYNFLSNTWMTVDDPNASPTAAFGVTGTTINGINDQGELVGFYSDGTNVDGFVASTPEPASLALMSAGLVGVGLLFRRGRTSKNVF
jgi:hypothetical protein